MGSKAETESIQSSKENGIANEPNATLDANPSTLTNVEGAPKKLPYPKCVFFIISNEFCERFNYYGMKTILFLYMTQKLLFDTNSATVFYHSFNTLNYFLCAFGAILSDSWLGKYKTILYLSIVYAAGSIIIAVGAVPMIDFSATLSLFLGLFLIAIGSGGIKPCVAAFGGDQFKLPAQTAQMATYFSLFYFSINAGSLVSTFLTPVLREDVHCFGQFDCYSLAFGIPGILMVTAVVVFVLGKPMYKIIDPCGNMVVQVSKCISTAISTKIRERKVISHEHWLDYATKEHGSQLVEDTKILLRVLVLFIPLPVFWALFDQQGSRWTFQATRMDGDIGFYIIKPDQMQVVNPFLILVFIPLYEIVFYPLLSKIGIRRPLQKLTLGGLFAAGAFVLSAFVEFSLEKTYPVLPGSQEAQIRFFNGLPCNYEATTDIPDLHTFTLNGLQAFEEKHVKLSSEHVNSTFSYTLTSKVQKSSECPKEIIGQVTLTGSTAQSIFLTGSQLKENDSYIDDPDKSPKGVPVLRFLITSTEKHSLVVRGDNSEIFSGDTSNRELLEMLPTTCDVFIDEKKIFSIALHQGGVHTVIMRENVDKGTFDYTIVEISPPNSMHMLWLLPQNVVMTLAEVMFSVTGLEFSYAQAPESMKSVLQSCWLLTVAFGNIIIIIVTEAQFFESQAYEYLLFAGLMVVDMIAFVVLAYRYKSAKHTDSSSTEDVHEEHHHLDSSEILAVSVAASDHH